MNQLLDLEAKLTAIAGNPCSCTVCRQAACLASVALGQVSPSYAELLKLDVGTLEFTAAEKQFRADEVARLQSACDLIGRSRCMMELLPDPSVHMMYVPDILIDRSPQEWWKNSSDLPDAEAWRDKIEHYRKHAMKPRLRKDTAEAIENPRVPGSFTFK